MKRAIIGLFGILCLLAVDASAQRSRQINEIQGDKDISPYVREIVRVTGIVTARTRAGFFIQNPDDKVDDNPKTSEAIYVFTKTEPGGEATVGNLVTVTGEVKEFGDPSSLTITEISMQSGRDLVAVESKDNALPKPVVLTMEDFKPLVVNQLEKYEGMRVTIREVSVVAPTDKRGSVDEVNGTSASSGAFYGVLPGFQRPFREPGLDILSYLLMPDKEKDKLKRDSPKIPIFDHNPERIRIESMGQLGGQAIDVSTGATVKNLTGVVDYIYRAYAVRLDPDNKPEVSGLMEASALPSPKDNQLSIASMNIERFFDDEDDPDVKEPIITRDGFDRRLKKISRAIRMYLKMPDVIGMVEAENLSALKRLAERINKDVELSGAENPKYDAYLVEGNDPGGIDSGFLVKRSRVEVLETVQFGKDDEFKNPVSKNDVHLNDRPPFLLRASIKNGGTPFEFTVIVNHLKSFRGYDDEKDAPFVRMKKKLQAEFLAKFVNERQKANPNERIALIGDFNFYQFSDGIMDVIGTIKGTPAAKDSLIVPMDDLVESDLVNLVDLIDPKKRYSYVFDGNGQVLDHFIVNGPFRKNVVGFGFAHINSDFPEIYRNDPNRVERFSDHDSALAIFNIQ